MYSVIAQNSMTRRNINPMMNNNFKTFISCTIILLYINGCGPAASNTFKVYNDTKKNILSCQITEEHSNGRTLSIKNIKPGAMGICTFNDFHGECAFSLVTVFDDGKKISYPPMGYLTFSWSQTFTIKINNDNALSYKLEERTNKGSNIKHNIIDNMTYSVKGKVE